MHIDLLKVYCFIFKEIIFLKKLKLIEPFNKKLNDLDQNKSDQVLKWINIVIDVNQNKIISH